MDQRSMLELVGDIYAAVTEPERWGPVLESISGQFEDAAILMGRMTRGATCDIMMSHRFPPEPASAFARAFGVARPVDYLSVLPTKPLATPLTPEAVQGEAGFLASEVYHEIFRPHGLRYLASAILHREPGWLTYMALWRGPTSEPFRPDELERFGWLAQHLGRAVALQYALASANATSALLVDVIDRFDRGAVIVDSQGRVRLVNRVARAILDRGDGLSLRRDRLQTASPADTAELLALIAKSAATSAGAGLAAGGMLAVSRSDRSRGYAVMVSPLSTAMLAGLDDRALALILIADSERRLPTQQQLAKLHRFTPAETRLAVRLLLDETPAEAAKTLGVSITTVRFHLRNLLAKTGTRRQAELIALLSAIHRD